MIRVLFVDDEPAVLEGLQNRLRPLRKRWDMHFAPSAQEALTRLASEPFDVVVCDMRMPRIEGDELFRRLRQEYPQVVRLVLSGQMDRDTLMRALPVAHQVLTKPCEPQVLEQAIERACALMNVLNDDLVKSAVGRIEHLPALPRLYWQLVACLEDAESSALDVARIIEQDVTLTARMLQLVNSAYFGFGRQLTSVQDAVIKLGLKTVNGVLTSEMLVNVLTSSTGPANFSPDAVQRHSLQTAKLASALLDDENESKLAFSAAMLHDVGTVVMATAMSEPMARCQACSRSEGLCRFQAEERTLGFSHAEVGARLLSLWGLPFPLIEAVAHHHHPARAESQRFGVVGAVHVADALIHELELLYLRGAKFTPPELDLDYLARVGVLGRLSEWRGLTDKMFGDEMRGGSSSPRTDGTARQPVVVAKELR